MKTYIIGNWKMNFTVGESSLYLNKIMKSLPPHQGIEVVVAPSTIALQPLSLQVNRREIKLAAQNVFYKDSGAFTGETSPASLRGITDFSLVGHSERRHIFHESDKDIQKKMAALIRNRVRPILCLGETESERSFGETEDVLRDQILGGLADVSEEDLDKVILAYEPVWAISSTKAARFAAPDEISEVAGFIQELLEKTHGKEVARKIPLLFGGSVNPSNAGAYLTIPGINGLLIGGSSLILQEFLAIIETAKRVAS